MITVYHYLSTNILYVRDVLQCVPAANMAASSNKLLTNISFPVYVIHSISPKHFVIGGGGGPSATGVPNGLVRFAYIYILKSPSRQYFVEPTFSLMLVFSNY